MTSIRSILLGGAAAAAAALIALPAYAISVTPFGPNGEGGSVNGQTFSVGPGGEVFEVDAFLNIAGQDLNGGAYGTSAQLSVDSLPAGLDYAFSSELSPDATDITLTYAFDNNTGADLLGVTFLSFFDAEIDEVINTFFNELATTSGALAPGQNFETDEPGFIFGDIYDHIMEGALDGTNVFPPPDDVSMALSFALGTLGSGDLATIDIMISEDGDSIGSFAVTQFDADPGSTTEITYSGVATGTPSGAIPEPGAATLFAAGSLVIGGALRRRRRNA